MLQGHSSRVCSGALASLVLSFGTQLGALYDARRGLGSLDSATPSARAETGVRVSGVRSCV